MTILLNGSWTEFNTKNSNIFYKCDWIEIGLLFEIAEWLPDLGISGMELNFSMVGNTPSSNECLNSIYSRYAIICLSWKKNLPL